MECDLVFWRYLVISENDFPLTRCLPRNLQPEDSGTPRQALVFRFWGHNWHALCWDLRQPCEGQQVRSLQHILFCRTCTWKPLSQAPGPPLPLLKPRPTDSLLRDPRLWHSFLDTRRKVCPSPQPPASSRFKVLQSVPCVPLTHQPCFDQDHLHPFCIQQARSTFFEVRVNKADVQHKKHCLHKNVSIVFPVNSETGE